MSSLILATRCANYQEVFVAGNIYFTDADCYARMTRVRMCSEHPGLIVRHHEFENYPDGTTPHTTAPLDYLILALSILLQPLTTHAIDLAGALISPLFALPGGWFLWWWSRRMKFRYRWVLLILYAISPILVQGTELGRPDHQSLSMLLVTIAICAEWTLCREAGDTPATTLSRWSIAAGIAWGLAIWVSAYEPLILFLFLILFMLVSPRHRHLFKARQNSWISFAAILAIAGLIERRLPSLSILDSTAIFKNWARTIGELAHVSPANVIWLRWSGYLLLFVPVLVLMGSIKIKSMIKSVSMSRQETPAFILFLLVATYGLTIWQARWAYFFVLIFALTLPALLEPIKSRSAVWIAFTLSILPILRDWDERLWPNDAEVARLVEQRKEGMELHELAISLRSSGIHPFLAPWWLSPSIAYWSGQPGVAGSSHEGISGIAASSRFFFSDDWRKAREILENHKIQSVFVYNAERVAQNSSIILNSKPTGHELCFLLERTPTQVQPFLIFSAQNGTAKLYRFVNNL
ncbi:MAG: hypothetical protein ABI925_06110 [Verrucomicrobiota bacterium]